MAVTKLVRWTMMVIIVVGVSFFAQANRGSVTVSFWPFSVVFTTPIALLVLASVILGILIGLILSGISLIKWRYRAKKYQKRILQLEGKKQEGNGVEDAPQ